MLSFESDRRESDRRGAVRGPIVVAGMLVFGLIASGSLWTYWSYHTAPFIPLQVAIAEEYAGSAPRVDGGHRRLHRGTPKLLWVVMRVDFNPKDDAAHAREVTERVVQLAGDSIDMTGFEQLNLRQFFGEEEKQLHRVDFEVPFIDGQPEAIRLAPDDDEAAEA